MATAFYFIAAGMIAAYAVLDGFDLGVGILHRALARTEGERRTLLAAIGPYWDGNEVWLIATAATLLVAFPAVLAAALSGMYLAIFVLVWLLLGRGLSIELRGHLQQPLWRSFWDTAFFASSLGLSLVLGIAIGNLVRGFSLDQAGEFQLAFFADFSPSHATGLLDTYTISTGVYAMIALSLQGARFVAWKCEGDLAARANLLARHLALALAPAFVGLSVFTCALRPELFSGLISRPWTIAPLSLSVAGLAVAAFGRERRAFFGSSVHLLGLIATTALLSYPVLLYARAGVSATIDNGASSRSSLGSAATWYPFSLVLALGYLALLFRLHRGKATVPDDQAPHGS